MFIHFTSLAVCTFVILSQCAPHHSCPYLPRSNCPPFNGNFTISAYQLYPENADFDFNKCILYTGNLWNSSVGIYNPYSNAFEVIEFEGISHNPEFHIGGVQLNHRTNLLSIVVDAGAAFNTGGQDISGTNYIMQWDPETRSLVYKLNLTTITQAQYGGYQDIEQDPENNVYVVGTYPSSILKVDPKGKKVETWYLDDNLNHTIAGYGGLAAKDWTLITNDEASGNLYRFDMREKYGSPVAIKTTPPHVINLTDAIQLPRKYHGTVLLVAERGQGVSVYRDLKSEWRTAEYLGLVEWPETTRITTAPVQVGDALYFNLEPFGDPGLDGPGTAGNRTDFLYVDISEKVGALLEK
ncbi:hypothetical protein K504DRAFT_473936 [Pleomassaria siparia CBS 279.74]|uniref:Tri14-like protein n=1 Tax=Pleomassaria siparia CBS 279.74 TaxID=1314801 RepID=A0A6G1JSZ2_9PLEO|nr:hypothetical protein K504DRAFT_473936 [Pleomassaria siparia CBS 279.74]